MASWNGTEYKSLTWRQGLTIDLDPDPTKDAAYYFMDFSNWLNHGAGSIVDTIKTDGSGVDYNVDTGIIATHINLDESEQATMFSVKADTGGNAPTIGDKLKCEIVVHSVNGQHQPRSIYFEIVDK